MSDLLALLVLATLAGPAQAAAQDSRAELQRLHALRARVTTFETELAQQRERALARDAAQRAGSLYRSGSVRLISYGSAALAAAAVRLTDSIITDFGTLPPELVQRAVLEQHDVSGRDSLLAAAGPADTVLPVDYVPHAEAPADAAWWMVTALATLHRSRLDRVWREWLPEEYGAIWNPGREGAGAMRELSETRWTAGQGCLAGINADCRRWLGVNDDTDPIGTRYSGTDLRRSIEHTVRTLDPEAAHCLNGDDAICVRVAVRHGNLVVSRIPSAAIARASLLRSVRERHGAEVLRRALSDSTGSIEDRLARASGLDIDELVRQWRMFVLRRGHADRVQASLPDALVALLTAGLMAALAARSGRWR